MSANIGLFSVATRDREYEFKPSFRAISRIGTGKEIVELYATLHGGQSMLPQAWRLPWFAERIAMTDYNTVLQAALVVLWSCTEDDISALTGAFVPSRRKPGMVHMIGLMPQSDIIAIARGLIRHGLIGKPKKTTGGKYSTEFNPEEFVYMAVAHLGLSTDAAWNLTMTEFQMLMDAKYPPSDDKPEPPSKAEYQKSMSAVMERMNRAKEKTK